jgi:transmembrane sensor
MTNERFIELFDKSRNGVLSEFEAMEWNEWMGQSEHIREMVDRLHDDEYLKRTVNLLAKAREEDWKHILEKHPELKPEGTLVKRMNSGRLIRTWIAAAAAILLIVFATYWYFNNKTPDQQFATTTTNKKQIQEIRPPDTTKARITLANGQVVALDTLTSGVLAMQGKVNVVKTSDGQIAYKGATGSKEGEIAYNTLTNPRGSKIVSINLSEGTKIWLNSESTLRYPVVFKGNERLVELTGEAYFEVAPSFIKSGKKRPFFVIANEVKVEVLGTHFNVNNYTDESTTKVTLLEGSVKVISQQPGAAYTAILKPGEQAALAGNSPFTIDHSPDLDQVMAWKNGTFYFNGENLEAIMKQLARYYNVEVEYEGNIPDKKFGGMINRNKNLGEVLSVLELSGIHFRVEGNKIIVLKS